MFDDAQMKSSNGEIIFPKPPDGRSLSVRNFLSLPSIQKETRCLQPPKHTEITVLPSPIWPPPPDSGKPSSHRIVLS